MTYDGCEKRYVLSPKRERIGKSLGRNFKRAFAQHSLESQEMGKHLLARIHKMIRVEMKNVLKESTVTSRHTRAVEVKLHNFSYIPLGGDQLTIARIRGSQSILSNSDNGEERLEGFVPVIEDWHTKMCFMEVTWFLD